MVRDLHDGAQQRFVHAIITLELALRASKTDDEAARVLVAEALEQPWLPTASCGSWLTACCPTRSPRADGGGRGVDRPEAPHAVEVSVPDGRFPAEIEATAYFLVAEALTNVAKHADARHASAAAQVADGSLLIDVSDDGIGRARPNGSGLLGLRDRVVTLGGDLKLDSPPGGGTRIAVTLPARR